MLKDGGTLQYENGVWLFGAKVLPLEMQTSGHAMGNPVGPWTGQWSAARGRAPAAGWRLPQAARLWLVGCALAPLLAAGCTMGDGVSRVWEVTPSTFDRIVLGSEQPVLVNFYKPG